MILLMEEILNHLGCIKPVKNGINYLSTGAEFIPSTVRISQIETSGHSKKKNGTLVGDFSASFFVA